MPPDERLHSAAAGRNAAPILRALRPRLPPTGEVLEIASGTGQHAVHFARAFPGLRWQPSDPDPAARSSIRAWTAVEGLRNVLEPIALDVRQPWPDTPVDVVYTANLLHVAPPEVTDRLIGGAARVLSAAGMLIIYGPFRVDGVHTAQSNARFDRDLHMQDPSWGIRDVADVRTAAEPAGLRMLEVLELPANNLLLLLRRQQLPPGRHPPRIGARTGPHEIGGE